LFLHSAIKGRRECWEKLRIEATQTALTSFSSSIFICADQGWAPLAIKVVQFSGIFPTFSSSASILMTQTVVQQHGNGVGVEARS
jgi:hypothetical protein